MSKWSPVFALWITIWFDANIRDRRAIRQEAKYSHSNIADKWNSPVHSDCLLLWQHAGKVKTLQRPCGCISHVNGKLVIITDRAFRLTDIEKQSRAPLHLPQVNCVLVVWSAVFAAACRIRWVILSRYN